jgi:hypothetical protein
LSGFLAGLRRHWFEIGVAIIGLGIVAVAGVLALNVAATSTGAGGEAQASPSAAPSSSQGPVAPIAVPIDMKLRDDCLACHLQASGGVGTRPIPALAHPLEGWSKCTSCHATDSLVKTAPGHTGIHADQCLTCHTKYSPPAPDRPHTADENLDCLRCHGTTKAHLPTTMAGWQDTTCWLCHRASTVKAPMAPHVLPTEQTCRSCHTAGKVDALPADHATRADDTCTACHKPAPSLAPAAPHDLESRKGMCSFCHKDMTNDGSMASPSPSAGPATP